MPQTAFIPPAQLGQLLPGTGTIIDVRTALEHAEKQISLPHIHAPLDTLNPVRLLEQHGLNKQTPLYLLCRGGKRATQAAEKFLAAGCTHVHVIDGGLMACEPCHLVVVPAGDRPVLSLERQVRVAAGLLVFVGALLALTVHSGFAFLPLFVGGGLVFAGLTDRCGMALLLAKAPWNLSAAQPRKDLS